MTDNNDVESAARTKREAQCSWCRTKFPYGDDTIMKKRDGVWVPLCDSCASDDIHDVGYEKRRTRGDLKEQSRRKYEMEQEESDG